MPNNNLITSFLAKKNLERENWGGNKSIGQSNNKLNSGTTVFENNSYF